MESKTKEVKQEIVEFVPDALSVDVWNVQEEFLYWKTIERLNSKQIKWVGSSTTWAYMTKSSNQAIPTASQTLVTFWTSSSSDSDILATWDRFTVTEARTYFLSSMLRYGSTASTFFQTIITKNGSSWTVGIWTLWPQWAWAQFVHASCYDTAKVWDYYEVYAYQASGGNVNIAGAGCFFWMHKV